MYVIFFIVLFILGYIIEKLLLDEELEDDEIYSIYIPKGKSENEDIGGSYFDDGDCCSD